MSDTGPGPEPEERTQRLPTIERAGPSGEPPSSGYDHPVPAAPLPDGAKGRTGRFWSGRRAPAAVAALLLAAAVGLLLYDVAAVRADRSAMSWRQRLADELGSRPLDDGAVIGGAAAAMVIGLWLLALAVTPGLRGVLTMRPGPADVRAGLDRRAAALVLRDRAMEVAGVQSVRLVVRRRRVTVRAVSHFRDLDDVREDLDVAMAEGIRGLGLVRPPRLSVRVRRPVKR
ncbi:DUF6286 domain-containing protein [Streptomyces sp. H27-D2]|uniref:DUF6286 domain-containing protein n=1 Tax=Streptomyces sp. H27-D2 TaxID=3046304 RepID=UPI002DC01C68|nr:DUF6286 domain-containing protein [Streptomyces sp. H27-D2]MEC4017715.1 DUF6286 domain-containing protein [Streptomyces sp. H27-D2]